MKLKFTLLLLLLSLFGCKKENSNIIDLSNLKPTEGFIDIPLSIVKTTILDNYFQYETKATVNNDTIGIIVKLKKNIPAGLVDGKPKNMFLDEGIEFISKGLESDKFLKFISNKYELNENSLEIKESQIFTCANLNQTATDYENGVSRFKIFLEKNEDYAELFVNFDFEKKIISFNEKDSDYRTPLIKLMKN